jgi:hypothetical protein
MTSTTPVSDSWVTVATTKKKPTKPASPASPASPAPTPDPHPLHGTWVCWYHNPNNISWDLESYRQIHKFNTIEDFWILNNSLGNINDGMFYLMREGYPPIWDHPMNVNGGGWTFRVDKKYAYDFWVSLTCYCIGERISLHSENVVGVSISPKIRFVTIRLWTRSNNKDPSEFNDIKRETENGSVKIDFTEARFTPNSEAAK